MRSPAQTWARLIGAILLVACVVGFAYSASFGRPGEVDAVLGILDVNGFHNVVHILSGLLGLAMARSYTAARTYCYVLAGAYTVVAIWGFAVGDGDAILSILPVNTEDNVLHALIALLSLVVALATAVAPRPSTHGPGRGFRYN